MGALLSRGRPLAPHCHVYLFTPVGHVYLIAYVCHVYLSISLPRFIPVL